MQWGVTSYQFQMLREGARLFLANDLDNKALFRSQKYLTPVKSNNVS